MILNFQNGVKILGERSTGTNFLNQVIAENFDIKIFSSSSGLSKEQKNSLPKFSLRPWTSRRAAKEILQSDNHFREIPENGGWKHAAATQNFIENFATPSACAIICLVRHPDTWSQSMHRNPFHAVAHVPSDYSAFLRAPWICVARDELHPSLQSSPMALYREKVKSYENLRRACQNVAILRYEDILYSESLEFRHRC